MKEIRVNFSGFWPGFNKQNNFFTSILRRKFDVVISEKPDYLFYSVFSKDYLKYNCVRIFYTGECISPDFNLCDYALGFDEFYFGDRYIRCPLYLLYAMPFIEHDLSLIDSIVSSKTGFCSFIYSNANGNSVRKELFYALSEYKDVSAGGRFLNNIGYNVKDKTEFERNYKFSIACENSTYRGYTTEKILNSYQAYSVPIYWGNPEISYELNEKAFINVHSYNSLDEVVEIVKYLDCNDEEYMKMLKEPFFNKQYEPSVQVSNIADFLFNIFDAPLSSAFRRNNTYWGIKYEKAIKKKRLILK